MKHNTEEAEADTVNQPTQNDEDDKQPNLQF